MVHCGVAAGDRLEFVGKADTAMCAAQFMAAGLPIHAANAAIHDGEAVNS